MPKEVFAIVLAAIIAGTVLLGSVVQVVARYLDRRSRGAGSDEVRALQQAVGTLRSEVEVLRGEFVELQERVDFAERLLAQGRDGARLGQGT